MIVCKKEDEGKIGTRKRKTYFRWEVRVGEGKKWGKGKVEVQGKKRRKRDNSSPFCMQMRAKGEKLEDGIAMCKGAFLISIYSSSGERLPTCLRMRVFTWQTRLFPKKKYPPSLFPSSCLVRSMIHMLCARDHYLPRGEGGTVNKRGEEEGQKKRKKSDLTGEGKGTYEYPFAQKRVKNGSGVPLPPFFSHDMSEQVRKNPASLSFGDKPLLRSV